MPTKKKDDKRDIIKSKSSEVKKQNKVLRKVLVGFGFMLLLVLVGYIFTYNMSHFTYQGVKFETVKESGLILYKTSLPVISDGQKAEYNFYLRTDPRKLSNISFD